MSLYLLIGIIMAIPPWGVIMRNDLKKTGIAVQLIGLIIVIVDLIVL